MLSGLWGLLKAAALALGWAKQQNDQNVGKKLEQTEQLRASVRSDYHANKVRQEVAGLSDVALDNELRRAGTDGE